MSQLFKIPNHEPLHIKRNNTKIISSPRKRMDRMKLKSEPKLNQQSKINFRPSTSFLNATRKSVHSNVRNNQSKKELIKKMVYLSEFAENNNQNIKFSTPVQNAPTFTPRRTPRIREYLVLPEFSKKPPNVTKLRSTLKDFIKKETLKCPSKQTPLYIKKNEINIVKKCEIMNESYPEEITAGNKTTSSIFDASAPCFFDISCNREVDIKQTVEHYEKYNHKAKEVIKKLQTLENCFNNTVKELPEQAIYDEFCIYLKKKQELNNEIAYLENNFIHILKSQINVNEKLKDYVKEKQELFEKFIKFHSEFQSNIQSILSTSLMCEKIETLKEAVVSISVKEKPELRRSLRLSNLSKKEGTPMQKKLSRINPMSKGIQKTKNSTCRGKGRVLQL